MQATPIKLRMSESPIQKYDCRDDWFLLSGYVGAVSSVAAIVLILCSKAYKDFSYRLYLDLATSGLVLSVGWCVEQAIPKYYETDRKAALSMFRIIERAVTLVSTSLVALVTCWLNFHIFLMVMCGVTRTSLKN